MTPDNPLNEAWRGTMAYLAGLPRPAPDATNSAFLAGYDFMAREMERKRTP